MKVLKFLLCGLLVALPVFAEEAEDRQTATSLHYVSHELDTRQNKLSAGSNKALTYTNAAGNVEQRTVKSNLTGGTTDTSLPMVEAVNAGLNQKQDDITTIDDHTAVTYTNNVGTIGQKGIYQDSGTYAEQSDNLIDAKTFNAALKNGLDSEFVCGGWSPNGECWLWQVHSTGEPINLFDMSLIPIGETGNHALIVRNVDGSITVTTTSLDAAAATGKKLSQLAPGLQVGKTYKFSINTTGSAKIIYLESPFRSSWLSGTTKTMTQDMLNSPVYVYASGAGTTATIYDIQIIEQNPDGPYTTLVPDGYTPVEYIEATGGSPLIELGLSGNMTFSVVAQSNRIAGRSQVLLASSVGGGGTWFGEATTTQTWGVGEDAASHTNIAPTTKISADIIFDQSAVTGNINGQSVQRIVNATHGTWCAFNNCGGSLPFWGKVWKIIAYQNNLIIGNFVPAIRNSDDKVGMYDTVSGTFFTNAGSGEFTAGPEINNIIYLPQEQN